jgi:hypothetical protein
MQIPDNTPPDDLAVLQWRLREITKGEIVPEDGAHQGFEVAGAPIPLELQAGQFELLFELPDGRQRAVVFHAQRQGTTTVEISCPPANLAPEADGLTREDRRLNEAVQSHQPVSAPAGQWTTFFNDQLRGVFSSDWQLWWGPPDVAPPESE